MRRRLVAVAAVLSVVAGACGDDDDDVSRAANTDASSAVSEPEDADVDPVGEEVDPDGVVRLGYDLVAAARGGITLDPRASKVTVPDIGLYHWIYGALMRPTAEGLEPDLAESATVVDATTIEIVLREGLTFSDGTPLDVEAVKASFDRNLEDPGVPAFRAGFFSLESVEVTGENTLELHIPDGTAASWLDLYLGTHGAVVLPHDFDPDGPLGAGPFTIVEYVPEQRMVLQKNPNYWNADAIEIAGIELINAPDAQAGASALGAGQVDFARLEYSVIDAARDVDVLVDVNGISMTQIQMCKSHEPFDDPRVRQALSYAIDRDAINDALFGGEGEPAWDLWPNGHPLHSDSLTEYYAYDPGQARDLLADAGLSDGFTFDLIPIPASNIPELAQILQQQWAEIGVTMNIIQSNNFAEDFYVANRAPAAIVPNTSGDIGKLDQLSGGSINNVCDYQDPQLDELRGELLTVRADSDEARALWAEIQEIIVHDALMLPATFLPQAYGYDGDRLGDFVLAEYVIPVPDIWQMYVKA